MDLPNGYMIYVPMIFPMDVPSKSWVSVSATPTSFASTLSQSTSFQVPKLELSSGEFMEIYQVFSILFIYIYIHTYIYITFVDVCFPEEQISNLSNMTYVSLQHFKCFFSGNMKEPGWTFGEWTLKKKPEWNGEADLNGVSHGDNRLFSTAQYNRLVQSSFSQGFLAEIPPLIVIFHGNICME